MEETVALSYLLRSAPNVIVEIIGVLLNKVAAVTAGLWFVYFLLVHRYVAALNKITVSIFGLPLGVYLVAQGSMMVFVVFVSLLKRARMQGMPLDGKRASASLNE
jgi:putative solute:sodium symporter small subunit